MDYYLNPDLREARRALKRYARAFAPVTALGFSMGGFGALLFAKAMEISRVVLVSPASPRFPEPLDPAKVNLAEEAAIFRHHRGELGGLPIGLQGYVLFDPWFNSGSDRTYARVLSTLVPGLTLVAMPGAGHPASALVTGLGEYHLLAQASVVAGSNAATFRNLHRQSRKRDRDYMARIADRIALCER